MHRKWRILPKFTQIYLQNVILYAKYWSTVRGMPDMEMVLHSLLFAVLCCQTKLVTGPELTSTRERPAPRRSREVHAGSLRFGGGLTFPEPWEHAVSLLLSVVVSIPCCFALFLPQRAGRFMSVTGHVLLRDCAVFYTKMTLTVNRKLRLLLT